MIFILTYLYYFSDIVTSYKKGESHETLQTDQSAYWDFDRLFFSSLLAEETVIDDFTDGDSINALTGGWFYYDDTRGSGPDDRLQAAKGSIFSVIDVSYDLFQKPGGGFDYDRRLYKFVVGEEGEARFGTMPFTLGTVWTTTTAEVVAQPFVGMSTMLAAEGNAKDITGKTVVKFKLRSHVKNLRVAFMVETMDIAADNTFAYYQKAVDVKKGAWTDFEIPVADLAQPGWTPVTGIKPFNWTQATRMTWEVNLGNNSEIEESSSDTLDVDDVILSDAPISVGRHNSPSRALQSAFRTFYRNGDLHLEGKLFSEMTNGIITLFDAKGKVVLTHRITSAAVLKMNVSANKLPNGLYFARVSGIGSDGKRVSWVAAVFVAQ